MSQKTIDLLITLASAYEHLSQAVGRLLLSWLCLAILLVIDYGNIPTHRYALWGLVGVAGWLFLWAVYEARYSSWIVRQFENKWGNRSKYE